MFHFYMLHGCLNIVTLSNSDMIYKLVAKTSRMLSRKMFYILLKCIYSQNGMNVGACIYSQ